MKRTNTIKKPKAFTPLQRTNTGSAEEFAKIDKWWEKRSSYTPGGPTKPVEPFACPEDLWEAACEYFVWMTRRPQYETRPFHHQGSVLLKDIPKRRPFTQKGLLLFFNMSKYVWAQYKGTRGEGYAEVVERIEDVMFTQKFEGATADLFNASIIARELGLKEHSEVTGANDGPLMTKTEHTGVANIDIASVTDTELDIIMKIIKASKAKTEKEQSVEGK